jgi:hypothetical protein
MASFYGTQFNRGAVGDGSLPNISTELDSVRSYQFEVQIQADQNFTLAAKKVTSVGATSEDIVVDRVNDKVYYPGKVTPDEITVTFDNTLNGGMDKSLFELFTKTYDFNTGVIGNGEDIKFDMQILLLTNSLGVHSTIDLRGAYVKKYSLSELQYSENSFNTIDVTFRWDYIDIS